MTGNHVQIDASQSDLNCPKQHMKCPYQHSNVQINASKNVHSDTVLVVVVSRVN